MTPLEPCTLAGQGEFTLISTAGPNERAAGWIEDRLLPALEEAGIPVTRDVVECSERYAPISLNTTVWEDVDAIADVFVSLALDDGIEAELLLSVALESTSCVDAGCGD